MGQRAVFVVDDGGKRKATTVQWSIHTFRRLQTLKDKWDEKNVSLEKRVQALRDIFVRVSACEHIGSLKIMTVKEYLEDVKNGYGYEFLDGSIAYITETDGRTGADVMVFISHGVPRGTYVQEENDGVNVPVRDFVQRHPHAQDGISLFYELGSSKVGFYMSPEYDFRTFDGDENGFAEIDFSE